MKREKKREKPSKQPEKKIKTDNILNKELYRIMYLFVGLFAVLIGYLCYFLFVESQDLINNPYNLRQENFSKWVVRGPIYDNAGNILAQTLVDEDGNEIRNYPYENLFAHVVGYSQNGKTGIEKLMNFKLLTSDIMIYEKVINDFIGKKSPGDSVFTTLDLDLQRAAYDALGDKDGAVVVLEPETGKILAMVSKPDYNPNQIPEIWDSLTAEDSTESSLLNRATQGLYAPGSTFKIITALEYIREYPSSYETYKFSCDGTFTSHDHTINCYHKQAHGNVDLKMAFAKSCNGAFAEIGTSLSISNLQTLCEMLLFNSDLPLSLPYAQSSYPLSETSGEWDILQSSIGQGKTLVTPIHQALIASTIANGGALMKPYFITQVNDANGNHIKKYAPSVYGQLITPEEAKKLTEWMRACVENGTGRKLQSDLYKAFGKTGTTEVEGKESTGWFVGFASSDKSQVAISIVVEEGGAGSDSAVPIAKKVFDTWIEKQTS